MNQAIYHKHTKILQTFLQQAHIHNLPQLSQLSGVSQWQISRLQHGLILKMDLETLIKLSTTLQIPLEILVGAFVDNIPFSPPSEPSHDYQEQIANLKQEYQRLQEQSEKEKLALKDSFQITSLKIIESWMLQWPNANFAIKKNPELPAVKLLPLLKPLVELLKYWGVEVTAQVGEEVIYNPHYHQLVEGEGFIQPGDKVMVRYVGYRHKDKLLHKARVGMIKVKGELTQANLN